MWLGGETRNKTTYEMSPTEEKGSSQKKIVHLTKSKFIVLHFY